MGSANSVANTSVEAPNGGRVDLAGALSRRLRISVKAPGDIVNLAAVTSMADVTLIAENGATLTLPSAVTALSDGGLFATAGGVIDASSVLTYQGAIFNTIRADGAGSRVNLSGLTSLMGSANQFAVTSVEALNGGRVDLGGAISRNTQLNANGPASELNLAAATSLNDVSIFATGGAVINASAVTTY